MTTAQLCRAFGLTPRQLQWLDEAQVVRPTVKRRCSQGGRYYDAECAVLVGIVAALRTKGLTLHEIRKVLPAIECRRTLRKADFLIISGSEVFCADSIERCVAIGCEIPGGVYVLDVARIRWQVQKLEQREKAA